MSFIPVEWLREHVEVPAGTTARQLAADLVKVGLEEESIVPPVVTGPLVVGRVLSMVAEPQSNGKTINYCRVDVGQFNDAPGDGKEPSDLPSRGIVCGAHNFKEGDLVCVVLPGGVLPGPFPISARKTYGHISDGMICSERELGLSDEHTGILVLTEKYSAEEIPEVGESLLPLFGFEQEILEINITPDRGYCFSMRGVAREYHHSTGADFVDPGLAQNLPNPIPPVTANGYSVFVQDDAPIRGNVGCDRFVTRVVTDIDPNAPTPKWMAQRLEQAGMRSLSLAVDVTNYVMLDLGQPLHAYDLNLMNGPILVRRARAGETLVTLDDVERKLDPQDLLITDGPQGSRVLGIAGVMGGASTEVNPNTTSVLIEAAHFDAVSIARSSRRHKLPSEAAKRFERGVDPQLAPVAAQRVVDLLVEYGKGHDSGRHSDLNQVPPIQPIEMSVREPERLVGVYYPREVVVETLTSIGCQVEALADEVIRVLPPSWRPDLTQAADLVEEIARLCGYDAIPSIVPQAHAGHGLTQSQKAQREVAQVLASSGLTQVLSYPFIGDAHDRMALSADDPRRQVIRLANPLSEAEPALRTSILDSLLGVAERNVSRGNNDLAIFETGLVYHSAGTVPCDLPSAQSRPDPETIERLLKGIPSQPWHLGALWCGFAAPPSTLGPVRKFDWADAVSTAQLVAAAVGVKLHIDAAWRPATPSVRRPGRPVPEVSLTDPKAVLPWHPGQCAALSVGEGEEKRVIGYAGTLHPKVAKEFGLAKGACALELDLSALLSQMAQTPLQVKPVSTYPAAKEDLALVMDQSIPSGWAQDALASADKDVIEQVRLFDVYQGESLPQGTKSLAFAVRMRALDHTLNQKETAALRKKLIAKAQKVLQAKLRS